MRKFTRCHFVRNSLAGGAAFSAAPSLFRELSEQPPQAPALQAFVLHVFRTGISRAYVQRLQLLILGNVTTKMMGSFSQRNKETSVREEPEIW